MKAEYKIERIGESVIAKAHRFHNLMRINEKMLARSKDKNWEKRI